MKHPRANLSNVSKRDETSEAAPMNLPIKHHKIVFFYPPPSPFIDQQETGNMKFTCAFLTFALTLFFPVVTVNAYDILQILFNEDHLDACDDGEWWQIENEIYVISQNQRALRGEVVKEEIPVDEHNRALWPNYCANRCAGQAPHHCVALNCNGYRRSLLDTTTRELFWATNCQNQISEMNNLLNNMRNNGDFSDSCKWFLGLQREYNCFTDDDC